MKPDEHGSPICANTARGLGVRVPKDVQLGEDELVYPRTGGMSVTPGNPRLLPVHRRPPAMGGWGKDPVFEISDQKLGDALVYRPDEGREDCHGFVEPIRPMPLTHFREALCKTASSWRVFE